MDAFVAQLKPWTPFFLRAGLAVVFVLFGLQKLIFPTQGVAEIQQLFTAAGTGELLVPPEAPYAMNYYMGLFELALGVSLALGRGVRWSAPLGALLVFVIFASVTFKYGFNVEDRTLLLDAGLIGGALALRFLGAGKLSVDSRKNQEQGIANQEGAEAKSYEAWAPLAIRVGLALSLLLSGYQNMTGDLWWVGGLEFLLAVSFITGLWVRYAAPLFVLLIVWNLFASMAERGLFVQGFLPDPTLSRDIGVVGAALALWALGAGKWSVDGRKESEAVGSQPETNQG